MTSHNNSHIVALHFNTNKGVMFYLSWLDGDVMVSS